MISLAARGGISIYDIIDQLQSCGSCPSYTVRYAKYQDTSRGSCCPMAVGNALLDMYEDVQRDLKGLPSKDAETLSSEEKQEDTNVVNPCPQCGDELVFEGGCTICKNCGWTKCD